MAEREQPAVQRVAEVLLADYASEYTADHLTWRDFAEQAQRCLAAAAPQAPERSENPSPPAEQERSGGNALDAAIAVCRSAGYVVEREGVYRERLAAAPGKPGDGLGHPASCICGGLGALAVHSAATAASGKTLYVAHRPESATHPTIPCPAVPGGGPDREALARYVALKQSKPKHSDYCGYLRRAPALWSDCDCGAITSYNEGLADYAQDALAPLLTGGGRDG